VPRYVHIKYTDPQGNQSVGSGYIVRDGTVLTANHVAHGTKHEVWCDGTTYRVDPDQRVLSETNQVDLGVLRLIGHPAQADPPSYAQIPRDPGIIRDCLAVGYPRWVAEVMQVGNYTSKQVVGRILPADQVPIVGKAASQLLKLTINWEQGDPPVPRYGALSEQADSLWSGMSGAVVTCRNNAFVLGVIHSHNYTNDPNSLTLTPLLALKDLRPEKQQEFYVALGIDDIDALTELPERAPGGMPGGANAGRSGQAPAPGAPAVGFSDGIRDNCVQKLAGLGVPLPQHWDYPSIEQMYRDCERRALQGTDADLKQARDVTKAIWLTAAALPVLEPFAADFTSTQLQYVYKDHVRCAPDSATLDGMLYQAAGAGIAEENDAVNGRRQRGAEAVTALGRFMLGIADRWKAKRKSPATMDLSEIDFIALKSWITRHLGHGPLEIENYLSRIRRRTWALIEFVSWELSPETPTTGKRELPTAIRIQTVDESGEERQICRDLQNLTSERDVEKELRDLVDSWLPRGDNVMVDLFLPRDWLDAGVEHWKLIKVDGVYQSLHKKHDARVRWAKHRNDPDLAELLRTRFQCMDWRGKPGDIPAEITGDPEKLERWLEERDPEIFEDTQDPPYYIGSSHGAVGHDPLRALLREGYGFIAWFTGEATDAVRTEAARIADADGLRLPLDRKEKLPRRLTTTLLEHRPVVVWSDPDGRHGFGMPQPMPNGPRRNAKNIGTQWSVAG
jgi:vWA-MoxR associated protein C-terminal domain/Trypsin-like peptidase domain